MALSEREQTALDAMELGLRGHRPRGATAFDRQMPRAWRYQVAAVGFLIGGLTATALGLALQSAVGDGVCVAGYMLIIAAVWSATRRAPIWGRRKTSRSADQISSGRPS